MERVFLLVLEYDGTRFCGWQAQPDGRSVQQAVEAVMSRLAGAPRRATAAGRTDAGVHAHAMPVTIEMPERWSCAELQRAANALLPADIAVRAVYPVQDGANARRHALGRRYRYTIATSEQARSPFQNRLTWALGRSLDLAAMQRSADLLPGLHDFRAFAAVGEPKLHYRCHVTEARWDHDGDGCTHFTIAADRFLHHMVRMLVGTMVDIGLGRRPEGDMARLLELAHNGDTSPPAPAAGLAFVSAGYPAELVIGDGASW